ncbi:MAG TPA: aminotransferase class I/II-fold pyridoxal phosphate-dependent enzyme [Thermotogota bacterium]|nr:aminotransferase class I/II-fold pyridoxal phosphate-dependent enzyme [Thermotogota bacterium]HPJ89736.1 aminotransferase class I/II-fold pyridoxal phosphate-dependent enzyme [Thermotogota bacterium]HPR96000.1 aminotransferase class I/II-fold pyridoxal phosphate-dependent enzyme [Thermotogota bacterium]
MNGTYEKHGGNVPADFLDFSISVNPYRPPFTKRIFDEAKKISDKYIYYEELDNELSTMIGETCHLTAGTTETLYLLFMAFPGRCIVQQHCYGEYTRTAEIFNRPVLRHEHPHHIAEEGDLVFLCNPDSPMGTFYDKDYVTGFVKTCLMKKAIPVIDDAFADFVEDHEAVFYDGAVHLRTFTKIYGLPGIRVGYFHDPYQRLKHYRMPWSLGSTGKAFVIEVLNDRFKFTKMSLPLIWQEKRRISHALNITTEANYFCMKVKEAALLRTQLREGHIAVRDCTSFGLPNHIRFAIRKPEENNRLLLYLKGLKQ